MRQKIKEYSRRFLSVFLCISIFCVFVISPVSATSVDAVLPLDNVLSLQDSSSFWYYPNSTSYQVNFTYSGEVRYVEGILWSNAPISSISWGQYYTIIPLGNNLYRFFGNDAYATDSVNLLIRSSSDMLYINFVSLNVSSSSLTYGDLPYTVTGYSYNLTRPFSDSVSAGSSYSLPADESATRIGASFDFTMYISPSDWKKYDLIFIRFDLRTLSFDSCIARIGDYIVPSNLSLSSTLFDFDSNLDDDQLAYILPNNHYAFTLDVSGAVRSLSDSIGIHVTGTYPKYSGTTTFGSISFVCGFVKPPVIEVDVFWYKKIFSAIRNGFYSSLEWLTVISSKLDIITGGEPAVSDARQTQEEINVSVNNQLVGAVEDWNTNIEVVETGYDMAVSKTTPALAWFATLADGIFNGMGWFGNVYFLVGLISVIMLVLSKSGLAHKIGSISRRKGD